MPAYSLLTPGDSGVKLLAVSVCWEGERRRVEVVRKPQLKEHKKAGRQCEQDGRQGE